ncbi:PREDICTED: uncharacterized protein LOC109352884 [Lupinus angustifolius]|uniref:uncharacterized protein LOC109352884 n=1 Tax=Lupinus angustifolius TaxID=3871 RepID=UPI00092E6A41|nr:PREDICTED: uncharacterized protein LOC109352884 [Lupinus angustifolius]
MPPKNSLKEPDDSVSHLLMEKLRENQEQQDARHAAITTVLHNITDKLAEIRFIPFPPAPPMGSSIQFPSQTTHLSPHGNSSPPQQSPSSTSHPPPQHPHPHFASTSVQPPFHQSQPRPPKLQLLPFDGSEPLDWIFQAEQFFQFYLISPEQRIPMIAFYMQGEALSWFKWMFHNSQLTDWNSFTRSLENRFGPSAYINHQAELFKLRQFGLVAEYQKQFERLCNRIWGLSQETILNCFLSRLSPEIRRELSILRPTSVSDALGLAKLVEAMVKDSGRTYPRPNRVVGPSNLGSTQGVYAPSVPPPLPIRRLSIPQMQERRAQGFCYNCDEKFHPGHRCQPKKFLLMLDDSMLVQSEVTFSCEDSSEETLIGPDTEPIVDDLIHFHISDQALGGHFSPKTLKFSGIILGHSVTVLVDTGSSHNILQPRFAAHLKLPITETPKFPVMVGNGAHIFCSRLCDQTPITLQQIEFLIPFYLLPIKGADVVLGIEWLQTLGPIVSDFSIPSMKFSVGQTHITLTGESTFSPQPSSFHQISRLLHNNGIATFHAFTILPLLSPTKPTTSKNPPTPDPQIQLLLDNYKNIFQTPTSLPPSRTHDHHIPLIPSSTPVTSKPYRYPHSQKDTMTTMLKEMLNSGIVTPSTSPFSSPVLLVHKKYGTWRFCVDYRALNAITVPDRFPIPTIDELLDELGRATIFSKIDLQSGYH